MNDPGEIRGFLFEDPRAWGRWRGQCRRAGETLHAGIFKNPHRAGLFEDRGGSVREAFRSGKSQISKLSSSWHGSC